jgi:hypothetical protein
VDEDTNSEVSQLLGRTDDASRQAKPFGKEKMDFWYKNYHNVTAFVKSLSWKGRREREEALQWATLLDIYRRDNFPSSSDLLEHAVRRLIALQLADTFGNNDYKLAIQWTTPFDLPLTQEELHFTNKQIKNIAKTKGKPRRAPKQESPRPPAQAGGRR